MTTTATTAAPVIRLSTHVSGGDYHRMAIQAIYADEVHVGHVYRSYTTGKWVAVLTLETQAKAKKSSPKATKADAVAMFTTWMKK